jgi:hypothetical protein
VLMQTRSAAGGRSYRAGLLGARLAHGQTAGGRRAQGDMRARADGGRPTGAGRSRLARGGSGWWGPAAGREAGTGGERRRAAACVRQGLQDARGGGMRVDKIFRAGPCQTLDATAVPTAKAVPTA